MSSILSFIHIHFPPQGVADDQVAANKDFGNPDANVVESLSVNGGKVNLTVTIGGNVFRETSLPIGSEASGNGLDGRQAKVTRGR